MLPGARIPSIRAPYWNQFRSTVIDTLFEVKADLYVRAKGLDAEGLTYEVAERLHISIDTLADFEPLHKLIVGAHHVAKERLRRVLQDQNGQHRLPF
jgi:hypothetical protein